MSRALSTCRPSLGTKASYMLCSVPLPHGKLRLSILFRSNASFRLYYSMRIQRTTAILPIQHDKKNKKTKRGKCGGRSLHVGAPSLESKVSYVRRTV